MQYFIGIVPPKEYLQRIVDFQKRWTNNRLPEVVEPHITIKAQSGLTTDMKWLNKVREVCFSFPRFKMSLAAPATFGNAVLYLGIESNQTYKLHRRLVETISPSVEQIERYMELDRYIPHLTLGQTRWGINEFQLNEMKVEAISSLAPYPTFTVSQIRVYREVTPDKYEPFEDILLNNSEDTF